MNRHVGEPLLITDPPSGFLFLYIRPRPNKPDRLTYRLESEYVFSYLHPFPPPVKPIPLL